jgi:hypothetical protein
MPPGRLVRVPPREALIRALNLEINMLQDQALKPGADPGLWRQLQALKDKRDRLWRQTSGAR